MTALSIIQDHCRIHALAVPSALIGSTDTQVQQLLAILNEVLGDIVTESKFQVVTRECVHQLSAGTNQGPMSTLGGGLFGYYQANWGTFYDRTLARPLYGPLNDQEWQAIQALPNPGPFYKFRIVGDQLYINPTPTDPFSIIAFEYQSTFVVQASDGTPQDTILADTDVFLLPENILRKWVMFRWKQIKGLPYQADESKAYDMLNAYVAKDKAKAEIDLTCPYPTTIKPGVFVPSANWPVV